VEDMIKGNDGDRRWRSSARGVYLRSVFGYKSWQKCCIFKYQCHHHCKKSLENIALKYALPHPSGCSDGAKVNYEKFRNLLDDGKTIIGSSGDWNS